MFKTLQEIDLQNPSIIDRLYIDYYKLNSYIPMEIGETKNTKIDTYKDLFGILSNVMWEEHPFYKSYTIKYKFTTLGGKNVTCEQEISMKNTVDGVKLQISDLALYRPMDVLSMLERDYSNNMNKNATNLNILNNNVLKEMFHNKFERKHFETIDGYNEFRLVIREFVKILYDRYINKAIGILPLKVPYNQRNGNKYDIKYQMCKQTLNFNSYNELYKGDEETLKQSSNTLKNMLIANTNIDGLLDIKTKLIDTVKQIITNPKQPRLLDLTNKTSYVYDIEVYKNFFTVNFRKFNLVVDNVNKPKFTFNENESISFSSNDSDYLEKLCKFLDTVHILIGFNNKDYDDFVLGHLIYNYIFNNETDLVNGINDIPYDNSKVSALYVISNEKITKDTRDVSANGGLYYEIDNDRDYDELKMEELFVNGYFNKYNNITNKCLIIPFMSLYSLDVKLGLALNVSLKEIECNLGENIEETSVEFNTDKTLTDEEIASIEKYCQYDVYMTAKAMVYRTEEFFGISQLVQTFNLDDSFFRKTKASITTEILKCLGNLKGLDDFNISFMPALERFFEIKNMKQMFTYYLPKGKYFDKNSIESVENKEERIKLEKDKIYFQNTILPQYFGVDKNLKPITPVDYMKASNPIIFEKNIEEFLSKFLVLQGVYNFFKQIKKDGTKFSKLLYTRYNNLKENNYFFNIENNKVSTETIEEIKSLLALYDLDTNAHLLDLINTTLSQNEYKTRIEQNKNNRTLTSISKETIKKEFEKEGYENNIDKFLSLILTENTMTIKHKTKEKVLNKLYDIFVSKLSSKYITVVIDGVVVTVAFGGLHSAHDSIIYLNMMLSVDVASYYPSQMDKYNYFTRSSINGNSDFVAIKEQRLIFKREGNPLNNVYKIAINSTYGVQKAITSNAYDPLQANNICINGELALCDLMLRLSPFSKMIQANTDGIVVAVPTNHLKNDNGDYKEDSLFNDYTETTKMMYSWWEQAYDLELELDNFTKIKQDNVNNYIVKYFKKDKQGNIKYGNKAKGIAYGNNDYDYNVFDKNSLKILRVFEKEMFLNGRTPSQTIDYLLSKDTINLTSFQVIAKTSKAYPTLLLNGEKVNTKVNRLLASKGETKDTEYVIGTVLREKELNKKQEILEIERKIDDENKKPNPSIDKINAYKERIDYIKKLGNKPLISLSKVNNSSDKNVIFNEKCDGIPTEFATNKLNIDFQYYIDLYTNTQLREIKTKDGSNFVSKYTVLNNYNMLVDYVNKLHSTKKGLWYITNSDITIVALKLINQEIDKLSKIEKIAKNGVDKEVIKDYFKITTLNSIFKYDKVDVLDSFIEYNNNVITYFNEVVKSTHIDNSNVDAINIKMNKMFNRDLDKCLQIGENILLYLYKIRELHGKITELLDNKTITKAILTKAIKTSSLIKIETNNKEFDKEVFLNMSETLNNAFNNVITNKDAKLITNLFKRIDIVKTYKNLTHINDEISKDANNYFSKLYFMKCLYNDGVLEIIKNNYDKLEEVYNNCLTVK